MNAIIVDDHTLFREGFRLLLATLRPEITLDQACDCDEARPLLEAGSHELILLDWWLDGQSGPMAMEALRAASRGARIVILSGERNPEVVDAAIRQGASGFIPKEAGKQELTQALQCVFDGGIYLPQAAPKAGRPLQRCFPELTPRQQDVLRAALRGLSNKQIARDLGISATTVATHLLAIYESMQVRNRTEAVYLAASKGALIE